MGRHIKTFHGLPYRVDSRFELVVTGRWAKGGAGEVLHNNEVVGPSLEFPQAEFSILAQLMQKAQRSGGQPANAFLLTEELAKEMLRMTSLGGNDPQSVHRTIDKLRKRLTNKLVIAYAKAAGVVWNSDIIQNHSTLGYRIGLPPENQHLEVLDPP